MSNDEFTKLFTYIAERFDRLESTLDTKANNVDMQNALALLDTLAKRQEISEDERLIMGHQLERFDRWVHELAKKINYTLSAP